jgi:hypothetical protein
MAYNAIIFIPDFIKTHPTDRELNYMDRQAYRDKQTPILYMLSL